MLVDVHCHIHEADYPLDPKDVLKLAHENSVDKMICVGTSEESSRLAVEFAGKYKEVYAAIGVHPHDSKDGWEEIRSLVTSLSGSVHSENGFAPGLTGASASGQPWAADVLGSKGVQSDKIVAVGEIGLDYYYDHSPRDVQKKVLKEQIEFALSHNLSIIFHVRDAFDDFWPIFDSYESIRGEIHSFTDNRKNLDEALKRGLYIGINGISTFTKDEAQQELYKSIPLNRLLVETDSPFLTPVPFRGKLNQPAFVKYVAEHQAKLRGLSLEELEKATTANAHALFAI